MAQPIWNTDAGSIGSYPYLVPMTMQLSASAVLPAVSVTYKLISGELHPGLSLDSDGLISGTPTLAVGENTYTFVIRATDNLQNIRDRTFTLTVTGTASPKFTTPSGNILSTNDSVWIELPIQYSNPISSTPISIRLIQGLLPPGLEIDTYGLIRGYAEPPLVDVTLTAITTGATITDTNNVITCLSTSGFIVGRPIIFTGTTFGDITASKIYYVKSIINSTSFTICDTQDGPTLLLTSGSGFMTVTLPPTSIGQPIIRTYSFTLELDSDLGLDTGIYSITVINQNTPMSQGGPGYAAHTRIPTIYNTRPSTFVISPTNPYYGYYIVSSTGSTIPPTSSAFIGTVQSDNYFSFKVIGQDFDGDLLTYTFAELSPGLTGDSGTGWITGTPVLSTEGISRYSFSVSVGKTTKPEIQTPYFNFSFNVANNIVGDITWVTLGDLGTIFNNTLSTKSVEAASDVDLEYRIIAGSLPPNLTLLSNGEITGYTAFQPTDHILSQGDETTFAVTIEAFSAIYPMIHSSKDFTITVVQEYNHPTDTLYIKATPSIADRELIDSLLSNDILIPQEMLYRPSDIYFGKATSVVYEHAYGIYASSVDEYIAAITKNHYWRNITLGALNTAVARNEMGEIIYEVVYSQIIDNLQRNNYEIVYANQFIIGVQYVILVSGTTDFTIIGATSNEPGTIFIATGPGMGSGIVSKIKNPTSISEEIVWPQPINLFLGPWYTSITDIYTSYITVLGQQYYTSLTPGYARTLYPNSLTNMRSRVAQELGQEYDSRLLPQWMTSQQLDGSTLGYTPAWVICYTKPGYSQTIKNNIDTLWVNPIGNQYTLNQINFRIDRFSVDKSNTYNYDKNVIPPAWTGLPSADPVPNPIDSKDFYALFPRKTILPNQAQ